MAARAHGKREAAASPCVSRDERRASELVFQVQVELAAADVEFLLFFFAERNDQVRRNVVAGVEAPIHNLKVSSTRATAASLG